MGQMYRWTPDSCIDPTSHTVQAMPVIGWIICSHVSECDRLSSSRVLSLTRFHVVLFLCCLLVIGIFIVLASRLAGSAASVIAMLNETIH